MSEMTNAVCFTCGLVIESPPRLSRLTNGQVCPACRDRVLDGLPPALPSAPPIPSTMSEESELIQSREEDWGSRDGDLDQAS